MELKTVNDEETTVMINPSPSRRLIQLRESLKLEKQLLFLPLLQYSKMTRINYLSFVDGVSDVVSDVKDLSDSDLTKDETVSRLTRIVSRLEGFKKKLEEESIVENLQAKKCRARIDHLDSVNLENIDEWNVIKLKRIIVDYLVRMSYFKTATKLSESSNILDLVDIDPVATDIFREAKKVIDALKNKEVAPALAWCADHKWWLDESEEYSESSFVFHLRLQEFIELVRVDTDASFIQAIHHARKHLAPWGVTHSEVRNVLQQISTALVFKNISLCPTEVNWDDLVGQFKEEFRTVYGLTTESLLHIYMEAGLSALKTPDGLKEGCTKEDPLSQESFRKLALPLPFSQHAYSKHICYISKNLMGSENPLQVLPNGYVYSSEAIKEMGEENGGKITCPRTGFVCKYTEVVQAYI